MGISIVSLFELFEIILRMTCYKKEANTSGNETGPINFSEENRKQVEIESKLVNGGRVGQVGRVDRLTRVDILGPSNLNIES